MASSEFEWIIDDVLVFCDEDCQACEAQLADPTGDGGAAPSFKSIESTTGIVGYPAWCGWDAEYLPEPEIGGAMFALLIVLGCLARLRREELKR